MASRVVELAWRGDNRSAVKALTGIATASDKTTSKLDRNSRQSSTALEGVGRSSQRLKGAIGGLAGTVGLGGLAFGLKDVLSAGEELQKQQTQLQGALKNTGAAGGGAMERLTKAAEGLSAKGGFGASENLQALTQFVTTTRSAARAQTDLALATDISRRTGKDFSTTVRAVMMLENGRTTGLARLGIAIPKVTTAEDALKRARLQGRDQLLALESAGYKFTAAQKAQYALNGQITPQMVAQAKAQDALSSKQAAFAALQGRYAGATQAFSKSTAGRLSNMRNEWRNLTEQLGAGLLPVMNKLVGVLSTVMGWLNKHRVVLYGVLGAVGLLTAAMVFNSIATTVATTSEILFGTATEGATAATIGLGGAMDALPILALVAGLVLVITHFDLVKKGATVAFKWIKGAAADVFGWLKGHWPLLAGILLAPFTLGGSLIFALFHKKILGAAQSVFRWFGGAWRTVKHIIAWPFQEAWKIIQGIISGIRKAVGFVMHLPGQVVGGVGKFLGGAAHTLSFGLLHAGGMVKPKYLALGGPVGTDTVPGWLSPGEGVVNTRGMGVLGAGGLANLNAGRTPLSAEHFTIEPAPVILQVDSRTLAQATVKFTLKKAARGPSSLVGGALVTGARTA